MCSDCNGLGMRMEIDPDLIVPKPGAVDPRGRDRHLGHVAMERGQGWTFRIIEAMAKATGIDLDVPFAKLTKKQQKQVLYGIDAKKKIRVSWGEAGSDSHGTWRMNYGGVIPTLMRRYRETSSDRSREQYLKFMREVACGSCAGRRLRPESLVVKRSRPRARRGFGAQRARFRQLVS